MKVFNLVAMCQNQWFGNSLSKNPKFKMEIWTDENKFNFTWNYIFEKNWCKVRDKSIIAFWFKEETLYINARNTGII